jgi:hypothetical protein
LGSGFCSGECSSQFPFEAEFWLTFFDSYAKELVDRRIAPGAKTENDMMQAFIKSGMTRDELMQQVYIHM